MAHARRIVHAFAEAGALLATARVEVGNLGANLRIVGRLLLAPYHPVLDVDVPAAVGLVPAVHPVAAANDRVPGPLLAVDVAPVAVGNRAGGTRRYGRIASRSSDRAEPAQIEGETESPGRGCLDERPARDSLHFFAPYLLQAFQGDAVIIENGIPFHKCLDARVRRATPRSRETAALAGLLRRRRRRRFAHAAGNIPAGMVLDPRSQLRGGLDEFVARSSGCQLSRVSAQVEPLLFSKRDPVDQLSLRSRQGAYVAVTASL